MTSGLSGKSRVIIEMEYDEPSVTAVLEEAVEAVERKAEELRIEHLKLYPWRLEADELERKASGAGEPRRDAGN